MHFTFMSIIPPVCYTFHSSNTCIRSMSYEIMNSFLIIKHFDLFLYGHFSHTTCHLCSRGRRRIKLFQNSITILKNCTKKVCSNVFFVAFSPFIHHKHFFDFSFSSEDFFLMENTRLMLLYPHCNCNRIKLTLKPKLSHENFI